MARQSEDDKKPAPPPPPSVPPRYEHVTEGADPGKVRTKRSG